VEGETAHTPEDRPGAGPADGDVPEHSRGEPLDEAQPSFRRRPELDTPESHGDASDTGPPPEEV
jgi:hypothetical protein